MFNDPIETGFTQHTARHKARLIGLLVTGLALVLSGCGDKPQALAGGSSPSGSINEVNYNGANPPSSTDVSSFLAQFWKPMHEGGYCVECHDSNQEPKFLNSVDINVAYDFAKSKVDVTNPANSILVAQVGSGHHCWLGSSNANNKACADIVQRYITNWLGASSDAGRTIPLTAPAMVNPGASKNFPATAAQGGTSSFAATVYPLLLTNCHGCHSPTSSTPQAPFFADDDVNAAYDAAKAKIDLNEDNTRDKSRFVLRLRNEFHNCWSGDCDADATEMKNAIMVFAGGIVAIPIDISLVTSKAMTLQVPPAIIATGGNRYENGLIAFWEFKEHEGTVAYDTSGVSPAIDLSLTGDTGTWSWVDGNGIEFMPCQTGANCGKAQGDPAASKKIRDRIIQTGGTEYAIEAWVVPANVTQDKRSIVTYSNGSTQRNFTLGQSMYNYDFINHSTKTNGTDDAKLHTADADEDLQATLQHVVMNFDAVHGRQIFVNGVSTGDSDLMADIGGTITAWDGSNPGIYPLVLGSEQGGGNSAWAGKIRMLAIYNHALTPEQVRQNFTVGVGQKFILLFSIEQILGTPQYSGSYIMFDVEQYDNYAYLFSAPKFINLNSTWTPSSAIPIKGMRIAINGKEAVSGQAFANLNVSVNATDYSATNGQ